MMPVDDQDRVALESDPLTEDLSADNERVADSRSHHYEFAHHALRTAFFTHPNEALATLTAKQELPLIDLWRQVGNEASARGSEALKPRDLSVILVSFAENQACALVTLPKPSAEPEAYFVALVSTATTFRYLTLERPVLITGQADMDSGLLCEWTADGTHVETLIEVPATIPDFVSAVRLYISGQGSQATQAN